MGTLSTIGGFFDLWSPDVWLMVVVVGYLYARFVASSDGKREDREPASVKQVISFYAGLVLFYAAKGSPIDYIGHHYLFSFHMFQQSIVYLVVPVLIWVGTPVWLLRLMLLKNRVVKVIFTNLSRPLIAIFLFNMLFSIYHLPLVMDKVMVNDWFAFLFHLVLQVSAFLMWFPVLSPIPELNRLTELKKIAYMFGNGVLLTPACALIIFADSMLYEMYRGAIVPFPYLSPMDDQQLGGVLMKILQEIVYGIIIASIFSKWYKRERREEEEEFQKGYLPEEQLHTVQGNWNRA